MSVGTALVLIALGVFFYLKPKVFFITVKVCGVVLLICALSAAGYFAYGKYKNHQQKVREAAFLGSSCSNHPPWAEAPKDCLPDGDPRIVDEVAIPSCVQTIMAAGQPRLCEYPNIVPFEKDIARWVFDKADTESVVTKPKSEDFKSYSEYLIKLAEWIKTRNTHEYPDWVVEPKIDDYKSAADFAVALMQWIWDTREVKNSAADFDLKPRMIGKIVSCPKGKVICGSDCIPAPPAGYALVNCPKL